MTRATTARLVLSAALSLAIVHPWTFAAIASDTPSAIPPALELPAGGVIFASRERVVVDRESIRIGLDRIEIDYVVRNRTSRPQTLSMTFPLPVIDMANLYGADLAIPTYDPSNPTNFVGVWTTLDGVAVEPYASQRAYALNQIDVTDLMGRHGVPVYPLSPTLAETLALLSPQARRDLEDADVIAEEDGKSTPQWALRTVYHWGHTFAPDASLNMRHHYRPVPGSSPWSEDLKSRLVTKYCLSEKQVAVLDARASQDKAPMVYWVHYAPGFNSWLKNPSGQHEIVIDKPEGTAIAATCAAGDRTIGERQIIIKASDRVDDAEVNILFVE